jgi:hypothetical protein
MCVRRCGQLNFSMRLNVKLYLIFSLFKVILRVSYLYLICGNFHDLVRQEALQLFNSFPGKLTYLCWYVYIQEILIPTVGFG